MLSTLIICSLIHPVQSQTVRVSNSAVEVRAVRQNNEYVLEFYALRNGHRSLVLASPTHHLAGPSVQSVANAVSSGGSLFSEAPSFRFQSVKSGSASLELRANYGTSSVKQIVSLDSIRNDVLHVTTLWNSTLAENRLHHFLATYAFVPNGKTIRPEETFAPALRPGLSDVIGDHFFRAPVVIARSGQLSASLIPDLNVLADNRPMPTILDLDAASGVNRATLMSYGFCDQRPVGHVRFRTDSTMTRRVPQELRFDFDLRISSSDTSHGKAQAAANQFMWARYGKKHFDRGLPQVMPFKEYPRICYNAALNEAYGDNKLGWFEHEINGFECGGIPSGWGYTNGWVSWQSWFNQLRSAWGMYYWGSKLLGNDWKSRATKMLNLALAAPMDRGACPTTYLSREKKWKGSLIMPDPTCYYDLTNMAWKGIWLLRWYKDFPDCPRKDDILRQCKEMALCMIKSRNADGSFPSWLTINHKPVTVLDRSAQSSLPVWFLFELASISDNSLSATERNEFRTVALAGSTWLLKNTVRGAYYYDFETFFSCSPKECNQRNGVVNHEVMRDPHTLQAPQNTLCMQWTAEALLRAYESAKQQAFLDGALAALDQMVLYQNVWPISYRFVANTYGGFGVQNSDGEYLDARQAQFGNTLADFGAKLGRKDLFERGVAAVRASMTLLNHPLHEKNLLYPFPNYPYGLMPENCGHGGTDEQNGRTGFDWGEGSACASMAELLFSYGGAYVDLKKKWAVGIDGVHLNQDGTKISNLLWRNVAPYTGPLHTEVTFSDGKRNPPVLATPSPSIRRVTPVLQNQQTEIIATPAWISTGNQEPDIQAAAHSGKLRIPLSVDASGLSGALPPTFRQGFITVDGTVNNQPIASDQFLVTIDANFLTPQTKANGWWFTGNVPEIPTFSKRSDFGLSGAPFVGTCEDGQGGFNDVYICTMVSPTFLSTKPLITLFVGGGGGQNVYVELVRAETGERLFIERGNNHELLTKRSWNVAPYRGELLQVRIFDRETGPWGHINVANVVSRN